MNGKRKRAAEVDAQKGAEALQNKKLLWRHALKGMLLAAIGSVVVLVLLVDGDDWERLANFPPRYLLILLAMVACAWVCNGLRTWTLARALGHRIRVHQAVGITLSMEFAIASTPGGLGGPALRAALQRKVGIPLPTTATMIAADVATDMLFFLAILPFALFQILEIPALIRALASLDLAQGLVGLAGIAAIVGAVLFVLSHQKLCHRVLEWFEAIPLVKRWRIVTRHRILRRRVRHGLFQMRSVAGKLFREHPSAFLIAFFFASIQWFCRYGVLPLALLALGNPVDLFALMLLQGCLFMLSLMVVLPGGGGSVEILSAVILKPLAGASAAGLAVIIWRAFTYYLYLLAGGTAFGLISMFPKAFLRKPRTGQAAKGADDSASAGDSPAGQSLAEAAQK